MPKHNLRLDSQQRRFIEVFEFIRDYERQFGKTPTCGIVSKERYGKTRDFVWKPMNAMNERYAASYPGGLIDLTDGRGMTITENGEHIYKMLHTIDACLRGLTHDPSATRLKVACSETFWAYVMPTVEWEPLPPVLFRHKKIAHQLNTKEAHVAVFWKNAYFAMGGSKDDKSLRRCA